MFISVQFVGSSEAVFPSAEQFGEKLMEPEQLEMNGNEPARRSSERAKEFIQCKSQRLKHSS